MTSIPPTIAAELALDRQNVALSVLKQSAEQQQALVEIIDRASRSAPVSETLGTDVNIKA